MRVGQRGRVWESGILGKERSSEGEWGRESVKVVGVIE